MRRGQLRGAIFFFKCTFLSNSNCTKRDQVNGATFCIILRIQVNRRSWAGNAKAEETICRTMEENPGLKVTVPHHVQDKDLLKRVLKN